jgi:hypothetical protein
MKTITVDGVACQFFIEKSSDGGAILNALVPTGDGDYLNYRHWYQKPAAAKAEFDGLTAEKAAPRVAKAKEAGVTGGLSGVPASSKS